MLDRQEPPQAETDSRFAPPASVLVTIVAIILIVVGGLVGLTLAGRDIESIAFYILPLVSTTVVGLTAMRKADKNSHQLNEIKKNTNGRLSKLLVQKSALEDQVRTLGHTPVTAPLNDKADSPDKRIPPTRYYGPERRTHPPAPYNGPDRRRKKKENP